MKPTGATFAHRLSLSGLGVLMYGMIAACALSFTYVTYEVANLMTLQGSSPNRFFITNLSYIVFEVVVWIIAASTALHLKSYARSVIDSPDGRGLDLIANALLLLVPYSILVSVGTNVKLLFQGTPYSAPVATCMNHLPALLVLIIAGYLYSGSRRLAEMVPAETKATRQRRIAALGLLMVLVVSFARYFYAVAPHIRDDDGLPHYGLPVSLLMFTYVLPYIVTWFLGLLACLDLIHYMHRVHGTVYKRLFHHLYRGLLLVFACTFIVQVLLTSQITTKSFSLQLLPIFGVIALLMLGCAEVYRGVDQLVRLERS